MIRVRDIRVESTVGLEIELGKFETLFYDEEIIQIIFCGILPSMEIGYQVVSRIKGKRST